MPKVEDYKVALGQTFERDILTDFNNNDNNHDNMSMYYLSILFVNGL